MGTPNSSSSLFKFVAAAVLGVIIVAVVVFFLIPDSPAYIYLMDFMKWINHIPVVYGSITLTFIYAFCLMLCFPGTPFNLAAGFLFGIWLGSLVTVVGSDLGASLAFLIGRTLGRDWAQKQVKKNKKFELVNLAVEKNAWLIIFLVRLSPIFPFAICNYLFGITKSNFWTYWSATTVGLIPCTVAYTYIGSLMRDLTEIFSEGSNSTQQIVLVAGAVGITALGIIIITLVTRNTLLKAMKDQESQISTAESDNENSREPILHSAV